MKKKLVVISIIAVVAALTIVGSTLAYFTDTKIERNTFVAGKVEITLDEAVIEKQADGTYLPGEDRTTTGNSYTGFCPGDYLPKDPTVTNTGSHGSYVRVTVTVPAGFCNLLAKQYSSVVAGGTTDEVEAMIAIVFDGYDPDAWDLSFSYDKTDKTYTCAFDYNGILAPGASVTLFKGFTFPKGISEADSVKYGMNSFTMDVKAYGTQLKGFAADESVFVGSERDNALDTSFGGTGWIPAA